MAFSNTEGVRDYSANMSPKQVKDAIRIIPAEQVQMQAPEFNLPHTIEITPVGQGQARFTEGNSPFVTWSIVACHLVILRTVSKADPTKVKYGYVHVNNGSLEENHHGSRFYDIAANLEEETTAIIVSGSYSNSTNGGINELAEVGIITTKHIRVNSDRTWLHVAYRPDSDEILAKAGSDIDFDQPISVFSGFADTDGNIPAGLREQAVKRFTTYKRGQAIAVLRNNLQRFAELLFTNENTADGSLVFTDQNIVEARQLFEESQQLAIRYGLNLEEQARAWGLLKEKIGIR